MRDGCARGWLTEKSSVNSAAGRELGKTTKRLLLKTQLGGDVEETSIPGRKNSMSEGMEPRELIVSLERSRETLGAYGTW